MRLTPTGVVFEAQPQQTLLAAAAAAGIRLPSSCRNGTCRACLGHVADGRVRHLVDWPGLLPEERAEGAVLPCVACAESDLTLHHPAAQPATRSLP